MSPAEALNLSLRSALAESVAIQARLAQLAQEADKRMARTAEAIRRSNEILAGGLS